MAASPAQVSSSRLQSEQKEPVPEATASAEEVGIASVFGQSTGLGGLGLSGIGTGQGLGTIGHGGIGGIGTLGARPSSSPQVRPGQVASQGRLAPEIIRRIVRQNLPKVRYCYENRLRSDPTLQGRITVRFVIGADGSVTSSSDAGSTLRDPATMSCVLAAFRSLTFPRPQGGSVSVTYPFIFNSGAPAASSSAQPASP